MPKVTRVEWGRWSPRDLMLYGTMHFTWTTKDGSPRRSKCPMWVQFEGGPCPSGRWRDEGWSPLNWRAEAGLVPDGIGVTYAVMESVGVTGHDLKSREKDRDRAKRRAEQIAEEWVQERYG